jgi:hypothetical protein
MTEPHYLSKRANWEAAANATGASLENAVADGWRAYLNAEYPGQFEVETHPSEFKQIYLEEDRRRNPGTYAKPAAPVAGDTWFDEARGTFMTQGEKGRPREAQCGFVPDVKIKCIATGRAYYAECKAQNDAGNAHERACKFATPSVIEAMQRKMGVSYHPIGYLFSGDLITKKKYLLELELCYGFKREHMLLWPKARPAIALAAWFEEIIKNLIV